jgi:nucleotide-binding universal stress UspA family protein
MTSQLTPEVTEVHPDGGVLVGDDGSDYAAAAVRAAQEEAVRRGVTLHVLRAWSIMTAVRPADLPRGVVASLVEYEASTLAEEQRRVAELLGDSAAAVEVHVVHAAPAKALIVASQTVELLVVGTRGVGGFKHLLVGSVAEQCIRYAGCSVLVVRG